MSHDDKYGDPMVAMSAEVESNQAKIDRLMLEYCPEEITPEQMANWEKHQVSAGPEAAARLDAAVRSSDGTAKP